MFQNFDKNFSFFDFIISNNKFLFFLIIISYKKLYLTFLEMEVVLFISFVLIVIYKCNYLN